MPLRLDISQHFGSTNCFEKISFQLLWVILIGLMFALIIQSLAANLGVSTGIHMYVYVYIYPTTPLFCCCCCCLVYEL